MAPAPPIPIRSAFVLGSTSEVAKAICRELARRGCARFHLLARNGEANQQFASELQQHGEAVVSTEQADLLADSSLEPTRRPEVGEFDLYLRSPLARWAMPSWPAVMPVRRCGSWRPTWLA